MMVGFVHTPGFVRAVEVVGGCGRTVAHEVPARSLRWSDGLGCAGASSVALAARRTSSRLESRFAAPRHFLSVRGVGYRFVRAGEAAAGGEGAI